MAKKTIKLQDLAQLGRTVDISDTEQISVRALTLKEMVTLFIESRDAFLPLYSAGLSFDAQSLGPFLLTAPELVAKIIALASDEPESADLVQTRMPATVQLIALSEVWKASVPDPKKANDLLSEVMDLLQKFNEQNDKIVLPPIRSLTTSPPASNS